MPVSNLNNIQHDVLWEDTATNPNLPKSNVSSLNKALKTTNTRLIKAINEVHANNQAIMAANQNLINQLNTALGDFASGVNGTDMTTAIKEMQAELDALKAGGGTGGTGGTGTGSENTGSFLLNF